MNNIKMCMYDHSHFSKQDFLHTEKLFSEHMKRYEAYA